jgi:hypothetical protein
LVSYRAYAERPPGDDQTSDGGALRRGSGAAAAGRSVRAAAQ